jgi:hypothetical protein
MVMSEFKELSIEPDLVPAAAKAAHLAATYLLQLIVLQSGKTDWIEQTREKLREHLEGEKPPDGHPEWVRALWHGTEAAMLENIFAHAQFAEGADGYH